MRRRDIKLNDFQKDALREISNIGVCHSMTSLGEMIEAGIDIEMPVMEVLDVRRVKERLEPERIVAGILLRLEGEFSGYMHILFPEESALAIVDILLKRAIGETRREDMEREMEKSVLKEVGNILTSSFCNALSDFLNISFLPSTPSFALDMEGSMLENIIVAMVKREESEKIIMFRCDFEIRDKKIRGCILFFPSRCSLERILKIIEAKME
ncbi:MAG: chemotaxis protein CheC [Candidatus Methanospirareceae archaeon]